MPQTDLVAPSLTDIPSVWLNQAESNCGTPFQAEISNVFDLEQRQSSKSVFTTQLQEQEQEQ